MLRDVSYDFQKFLSPNPITPPYRRTWHHSSTTVNMLTSDTDDLRVVGHVDLAEFAHASRRRE